MNEPILTLNKTKKSHKKICIIDKPSTIEKSGGVTEGHDVGFLLYCGERPKGARSDIEKSGGFLLYSGECLNPTFRVGAAYPTLRSKRGFTGGSAPNGGAHRNIKKYGEFISYSGERPEGAHTNNETNPGSKEASINKSEYTPVVAKEEFYETTAIESDISYIPQLAPSIQPVSPHSQVSLLNSCDMLLQTPEDKRSTGVGSSFYPLDYLTNKTRKNKKNTSLIEKTKLWELFDIDNYSRNIDINDVNVTVNSEICSINLDTNINDNPHDVSKTYDKHFRNIKTPGGVGKDQDAEFLLYSGERPEGAPKKVDNSIPSSISSPSTKSLSQPNTNMKESGGGVKQHPPGLIVSSGERPEEGAHINIQEEMYKIRHICQRCDSVLLIMEDGVPTCINPKCGMIYTDVIDYSPEWKFYGCGNGDNKHNTDITRCGNPINPLLMESSFGCKILCNSSSSFEMKRIRKWTEWTSTPHREKSLYEEFLFITTMAHNSGIPKIFIDYAMMIHKDISEQKMFRGMNRDGIKAASIYISCRLNGCPRTAHEIAEIFKLDKQSTTLGCSNAIKILNNIERNVEHSSKSEFKTTTASSFIERYCCKLGISQELTLLAKFIAIKTEQSELLCNNTPQSSAAGIIQFISQTFHLGISKVNIKSVCGVSEVTIGKCCKKMESIKEQLIPKSMMVKYGI